MADFEVNFTLDPQPEIEADFNIEVSGVTEHNLLSNRDLPDQHPISAITGLQEALDTIPDDYVSDVELEAALLEKQDVIRDLSEIRQGATLGATAVQPSELESYATTQYVDNGLAEKQDTLTAGANVQIVGNTISATDTTYTAGTGISIVGNVISNTQTSAEWGNIGGDLTVQTDLQNALNLKANVSDIPTKTSDLENDIGYITGITGSDVVSALGYTPYDSTNPSGFITNSALVGYATQNWVVNQNYITGDYIGDAVLTIQRNNTNIDTFTANAKVNKTINIAVPTTAAEVNALPDSTKYGYSIDLSLNTTDYKLTLTLKDQDGTVLNSKTVDFPIESVVVNGTYDSINKKIVLTLQNGNTIDIPVSDLIAGLQTEITSENKLDADLVDDSTSTSKFVTSNEKNTWNSKQDTISDLATIRSGAALGATALQSGDNISELVNNSGYITSADLPTNHVTTDTAQTVSGSKTFTGTTAFQNGAAAGCVVLGADVSNTTVSNNVRKLGRMSFHTYENTVDCAFVSTDSDDGTNYVEFGGRVGDGTNTSPDILKFTVATTHNSRSGTAKKTTIQIDKDTANFTVQPKYNNVNLATETYVNTGLATKQATLVSGTNIKTINNQSLLGSGNIDIQGGSDVEAFTAAEVLAIWEAN